jgi:cytosine/creatinine deaminase
MYKIARVVIGENQTFVGGAKYLKERSVEVVVFDNEECKDLMSRFIKDKPTIWNEDIGE